MNTKEHFYELREKDPAWRQHWENLLDDRFVVINNELVVNLDADIFRMGFTVEEVSRAIGKTGYTDREKNWYQSQPDRFNLIDGKYVEDPAWRRAYEEQKIRDDYESKLSAIGAPYSNAEQKTWLTQEAEALAWIADHGANCKMVSEMAAVRGISMEEMCSKILENSELFKPLAGKLLGEQQAEIDKLNI